MRLPRQIPRRASSESIPHAAFDPYRVGLAAGHISGHLRQTWAALVEALRGSADSDDTHDDTASRLSPPRRASRGSCDDVLGARLEAVSLVEATRAGPEMARPFDETLSAIEAMRDAGKCFLGDPKSAHRDFEYSAP